MFSLCTVPTILIFFHYLSNMQWRECRVIVCDDYSEWSRAFPDQDKFNRKRLLALRRVVPPLGRLDVATRFCRLFMLLVGSPTAWHIFTILFSETSLAMTVHPSHWISHWDLAHALRSFIFSWPSLKWATFFPFSCGTNIHIVLWKRIVSCPTPLRTNLLLHL